MNIIKEIISAPSYDFVRTDEHLAGKLIFLTFGGSHAYGTSTSTSDVDIRGCAFNSKRDLLGMGTFEHFEDKETDTTIYSFNKLIRLLIDTNPNTIELLGCKPEHYLHCSSVAQELIDKRRLFLSRRASKSFGGYASQQLRRIHSTVDKTEARLNKHAMHLIRLYMMAIDIFEKEEIVTYRSEEDVKLLLSIRAGDYMGEDKLFTNDFYGLVHNFERRFEYALENSSLPEHPDLGLIEEFVMSVNERVVTCGY